MLDLRGWAASLTLVMPTIGAAGAESPCAATDATPARYVPSELGVRTSNSRLYRAAGLMPSQQSRSSARRLRGRTTIRYDMARANLDRHAAHSIAAYLAGMAIG